MNCFSYSILMSLGVLIALTGCPKKRPLTPQSTVMGSNSQNREDWINAQDASLAEGLVERDASSMDARQPGHVFSSVYFDFDNFSIKSTEREALSQLVRYLNQNPQQIVLLEGHCDWYGTTEYNLTLGDKRAVTVKSYLVDMGITPNRLETLSKGSLEATPNLDKAQAAKDRRVDIIMMK